LALMGTQQPAAVIAEPPSGTPAAQAGFMAGDRLVSVDGKATASWNDVRWQLMDTLAGGGVIEIDVETDQGLTRTRRLALPPTSVEPDAEDPLAVAGLTLQTPRPLVRQLVPDSAGVAAGLQDGDIILSIGGISNPTAREVVARVQEAAGQALPMTIERQGDIFTITITPTPETNADGTTIGRIGVMLGADLDMVTVKYGPIESLWR